MERLSFLIDDSDLRRALETLDIVLDLKNIHRTQRGSVIIGMRGSEKVAVKIASKDICDTEFGIVPARSVGLQNEICALLNLKDSGPFPEMIACMVSPKFNICVMRYINGMSGFGIPANQRLSAVQGLFVAVRRLHELGYTHGDIQPNNIIFTDGQRPAVTLIDFELISRIDSSAPQYPGKREYLSPESANEVLGIGYVSRHLSQDLYALALSSLTILADKEQVTYHGHDLSDEQKLGQIAARNVRINTPSGYSEPVFAQALERLILDPKWFALRTVDDLAKVTDLHFENFNVR